MQIRKGNKATPKGPRESAGATLLSQLESARRPSFHKKPSPASIKKKNAQTKAPARAPVNTTHATKRARFAGFTSFVMSAPFHSPRTHCLVQTSIPEYAFICSVATRPVRNRSGAFPKCDRHIKRYAKKALGIVVIQRAPPVHLGENGDSRNPKTATALSQTRPINRRAACPK